MASLYPLLWRFVIGTSLGCTLLATFIDDSLISLHLAGVLILFIGIPHGAADHRLFQRLYAEVYGQRALFLFYVMYLGLMGLVLVGWYLQPILTLILFVLLSAYHFGQGNFPYLKMDGLLYHILYLLWGLWVILVPVLLHFDAAEPILEALTQRNITPPAKTILWTALGTFSAVLALFLLFLRIKAEGFYLWRELVSLLVLAIVFYYSPLLLGFAIYFALWHALPSALDQIRFLFRKDNLRSIRIYMLTTLPFSGLAILSTFGIVMLQPQIDLTNYWSSLFAFIAALTLPHMLVLDRVYDRLI